MNQELTTYNAGALAPVSVEKLTSYLDTMGLAQKLTPQEKTQFIEIAQVFGLNPFIREIYATKYGSGEYAKFSIIVGYEVYLKRAERTGQLAGWNATTSGTIEGGDLRGIVTIYRKDWSHPMVHEVYYSEYVQTTFDKSTNTKRPNKMWEEKPFTMIKKVAIAQAFRMAFSLETGGMPYTADEMPTIQEQAVEVIQLQAQATPMPPRMGKQELADAMKALTDWQNECMGLLDTPDAYNLHLAKLRGLKGNLREEMVKMFDSHRATAKEVGLEYNEDQKMFYAPIAVEEVV